MKMCCFSVSFTRLSLLLLVAITQSSRSIPLGVVTFAWDDSTGSGIGEIEEPIATLKDNNGQEPFVQISSNKWELNNDHEKALPEAERVLLRAVRQGPICNFDKHCDHAQFCHEHYKYCEKKKYVGQKCRRTGNCLPGAICMWGACHKEKKPGFYMSRCKRHYDCKGLCCAKEEGESVCKPYLKEGQNCSVSTGGISYSFNHDCPCGYGLVCKSVGRLHHGRWTTEHMQCTKLII